MSLNRIGDIYPEIVFHSQAVFACHLIAVIIQLCKLVRKRVDTQTLIPIRHWHTLIGRRIDSCHIP